MPTMQASNSNTDGNGWLGDRFAGHMNELVSRIDLRGCRLHRGSPGHVGRVCKTAFERTAPGEHVWRATCPPGRLDIRAGAAWFRAPFATAIG